MNPQLLPPSAKQLVECNQIAEPREVDADQPLLCIVKRALGMQNVLRPEQQLRRNIFRKP